MCQNYRVEYHQIIEMDGLRTVFAALRLIVPQSVRTPAAGFDDFLRVESKILCQQSQICPRLLFK